MADTTAQRTEPGVDPVVVSGGGAETTYVPDPPIVVRPGGAAVVTSPNVAAPNVTAPNVTAAAVTSETAATERPRTTNPGARPEDRSTDQLARIEDKTARIEEKYARSEAAAQRVLDRFELAAAQIGELALKSDLTALRSEMSSMSRSLRGLPGTGALVLTGVITAVVTAALIVLALRYAPGLLPVTAR